jgi:hypothetical protein
MVAVAGSGWRKFAVRKKNEQKESNPLETKLILEFDTNAVPRFIRKEICLYISLKNMSLGFL